VLYGTSCSLTLVLCGQTTEAIELPFGVSVTFKQGDSVLDGVLIPLTIGELGGTSPKIHQVRLTPVALGRLYLNFAAIIENTPGFLPGLMEREYCFRFRNHGTPIVSKSVKKTFDRPYLRRYEGQRDKTCRDYRKGHALPYK
jgi:hypothetical protein